MKIIFLILLSLTVTTSKADTIDFWHVYYSNKSIGDFTIYGKNAIILKLKDVKKEDSIKVLFYRTHLAMIVKPI